MTYHQYSTIDMGCIANSKGNIELLEAKLRERVWIHQYRHVTFIVQSSFLTSTMTLIVIITIYDVMSKRVVESWKWYGFCIVWTTHEPESPIPKRMSSMVYQNISWSRQIPRAQWMDWDWALSHWNDKWVMRWHIFFGSTIYYTVLDHSP